MRLQNDIDEMHNMHNMDANKQSNINDAEHGVE